MVHYRSEHSDHSENRDATVFSVAHLDPQLDSLVDILSQEIASQPAVSSSEGRVRHSLTGANGSEESVPSKDALSSASLEWSRFTSSLLFGLGILGFLLGLPSLQIGTFRFDLMIVVIAAFCTTIGAGCMLMTHIAADVSRANRQQFVESTARSSSVEWLLGALGILFLISAAMIFSSNRNQASVLPNVIRLALVGLTCSTVSLQMQFAKVLRTFLMPKL